MSGGLGASLAPLGDVSGGGAATPSKELDQSLHVRDAITATKRYSETDAFGIGVAPLQTPKWYIGRTIAEVVNIQQSMSPAIKYSWTIAEQVFMAQALSAGRPVALAENIGIHPAQATAIAVTILQVLGIAPTPLPSLKYTQTLVQGIGSHAALLNFFGGTLHEAIGQSDHLTEQFRANPVISDLIHVAPALLQTLHIKVTLAEGVKIAAANPLKMIFRGELDDGIGISIGYLSPNGQFSTWVMNTRTAAVTEYTNFMFNSFAQMGNTYLGASDSGLYHLVGDTDAGTNIIADIKSGFAEWGGSKFTMFESAYLGVRGGGDFVLRLITGDGHVYNYAVSARDMRTTRIHIGKGIRTRYFAFELISTGQDFDLDNVEWVPLIAKRRV